MDLGTVWHVIRGPLLLLLLIYAVWFARYPMWQLFTSVEPIFLVLILSYFVVLIFSLVLLRIDAKTSLPSVFKMHGYFTPLFGLGLAVLFQTLWFAVVLMTGGRLEMASFPSLRGYETYSFYSLLPAFGLYFTFAVFGALVEEVAFRRYIQSKLAQNFSVVWAVSIAALFFSVQHIHIFNLAWIGDFLQTQFPYVFCFGIFVGYFFMKSGEDLWSAFAFHGAMNAFNVSLPFYLGSGYGLQSFIATITSFTILVLLLRLKLRKPLNRSAE